MALSDEEQQLLDQLEASLTADDPKFAQTFGGQSPTIKYKRRATLAGLGFVAGMVLLVVGMRTIWPVSVAGFLLMFTSAVIALGSWRKADSTQVKSRPSAKKPDTEFDFTGRAEERWKKRQQGGR